jgi:hypothetical protein
MLVVLALMTALDLHGGEEALRDGVIPDRSSTATIVCRRGRDDRSALESDILGLVTLRAGRS